MAKKIKAGAYVQLGRHRRSRVGKILHISKSGIAKIREAGSDTPVQRGVNTFEIITREEYDTTIAIQFIEDAAQIEKLDFQSQSRNNRHQFLPQIIVDDPDYATMTTTSLIAKLGYMLETR